MKGSGRLILFIALVGSLFLIQVFLSTNLFTLSYSIQKKSSRLTEREDYARHLKYEVERLKAPYRLSEQIREHALKLDFPREIHVIQMPASLNLGNEASRPLDVHPASGLGDWFGRWIQVAQAKTDSR